MSLATPIKVHYEIDHSEIFYVPWWIRRGETHFGADHFKTYDQAFNKLLEIRSALAQEPDKITAKGIATVKETRTRKIMDMVQTTWQSG